MKALTKRTLSFLLAVIMVVSMIPVMAFSVNAETKTEMQGWTFTEENLEFPFYINEIITEAPQAYEVELNMPENPGTQSTIIGNWYSGSGKYFGLAAEADGTLIFVARGPVIKDDGTIDTDETTQVNIPGYSINGKGWIKIAVVRDTIIDEEAGIYKAVYTVYENGVKMVEYDPSTASDADARWKYIPQTDVVAAQSGRKLSIGSHSTKYFAGELKSLAIYSQPLTEDQVKASYETGVDIDGASLSAYYDYAMDGNTETLIKDQTGNGHDAIYTKNFYEREEAVRDYAYSFAFIGDTQKLVLKDANSGTSYTSYIYDWIVDNKDEKKIQHVFGLGDITDKDYESEWEIAVAQHKKLEDAGIPYGIIPGNHDRFESYAKYNQYFGAVPYFTDRIDGLYDEAKIENYYMNFEVGSHKYMLVALQYAPSDDVLAWANEVIAANPDRRVIVTTHYFLNSNSSWSTSDTSNLGKQIWDKILCKHANIIMAVGGHVVVNDIKHRTDVGENGNTVHTFLIDPQGLDLAQSYKTGMVAMFYFSEDGSDVQVEYISTQRTIEAQKTAPETDDILYNECNQFDFKLDLSGFGSESDYGRIPDSFDPEIYKFALFSEGEFINGYKTWNEAVSSVNAIFAETPYKELQLLLLGNYDNVGSAPDATAFNGANGRFIIDLNRFTFTASEPLLVLNACDNANAVNITVKNGTLLAKNCPIVKSGISEGYTGAKIWNVTFEKLELGAADGNTLADGIIYAPAADASTSDSGSYVNLTFNGCTFNLKANLPESNVALFKLSDGSENSITVNLKINGGEFCSDIDVFKAAKIYYGNETEDIVLFGAYDGKYTKLLTHTTEKDYAHYSATFPAVDGERYFVEISDDGTQSVYELTSLTMLSSGKTFTIELGENIKYLSAYDYPFVVFDNTGKFYGAYYYFLGNNNATSGGAMGSAITNITVPNANDAGVFIENPLTAYILMRADYTTRILEGTTTHENYNKYTYARGTVIIDMNGYTITQHEKRGSDVNSGFIFDCEIKKENSPSNFVVKNGSFKSHGSAVIRFRSNSAGSDTKDITWTFENVNFGLAAGTDTAQRFFHFSGAKSTTSVAKVTLNLNDCVYDIYTVPTNKTNFSILGQALWEAAYLRADINVSGGKILAKNLDKFLTFGEEFSNTNGLGPTLRVSAGSDGEYMKLVIPDAEVSGEAIKNFEAITILTDDEKEMGFRLTSSDGVDSTYELVFTKTYIDGLMYNLSLDSSMSINLAIPKAAYESAGFTVTDGTNALVGTPTVINGADYYLVTINCIDAISTTEAKTFVLKMGDAKEATVTLAVAGYAAQLLKNGETDVEKELARAILQYALDAEKSLGTDNADAIEKLTALLGTKVDTGVKNDSFGTVYNTDALANTDLYGVFLRLANNPGIVFQADEGKTITFTVTYGGVTKTMEITKAGGEVVLDLKVYNFDTELTINVGGVDYSYNLATYLTGLCDLAEAESAEDVLNEALANSIYNLVKAAQAYRAQ